MQRTELFWLLSLCGFAAMSLACGLLAWPQLSAAWPSIEERIDRFRRQPPLAKVVLLLFVGAFVVFGGGKTNQVDQTSGEAESFPLLMVGECPFTSGKDSPRIAPASQLASLGGYASPLSVSPADIARGWQLWEVRTNHDVCYTMPEGAAMATNWWIRGAFEDCSIVRLGDCSIGSCIGQSNNPNNQTMSFPFGSNGYSSVWALTWGKLRFALADTNTEIAAVGAPMSAVPYRSRLWSAADTNGSWLVTWENFALNRDTNTPVNAQIELRSTGDFIVRSNEVETVYRYIDDFDWDGDGIVNDYDWDPYWYDGDFTGQPEGWTEYVNESVGSGLENGYYKLTATFPVLGFKRAVLTVGYDEVVIAEPGEYVFLLEKGEDYEFDIEPFSPDVRFEVADDVPLLVPPLMLLTGAGVWMDWTMDGGNLVFTVPSFTRPGHCRWMPTFQATPSACHLGPGDSPQTFTAVLSDYSYSESVRYEWDSDDWNVKFSNPHSAQTEIDVWEMTTWGEGDIWVTATIGTNELVSAVRFHYGEHRTPQTDVLVDAPNALLLNSNSVDSAKVGQVRVVFAPDVEAPGTLALYCRSGADRIRLTGECSWAVSEGETFYVDIEGVRTSTEVGDVLLEAVFSPDDGSPIRDEAAVTVVQVNDVALPGAPDDGLVISTGTSVALDLDVLPEGADDLLSVIYKVRRLRGDGTYTDWEYAAGGYSGADAIYNPAAGGIYQVQALASPGWGAADERYYVWEDYSDYVYGVKVPDDMKAFGVCDSEWQKNVRNSAKSYLGSIAYARSARVNAYGGFAAVRWLAWKCNIFVAHRLVDCGLPVPVVHDEKWPPLANEWGNAGYLIPGWMFLGANEYPQPGMVAVKPSAGGHGHVGIVDFDGMLISAQEFTVTRASDPTTWPVSPVFRTYKGND